MRIGGWISIHDTHVMNTVVNFLVNLPDKKTPTPFCTEYDTDSRKGCFASTPVVTSGNSFLPSMTQPLWMRGAYNISNGVKSLLSRLETPPLNSLWQIITMPTFLHWGHGLWRNLYHTYLRSRGCMGDQCHIVETGHIHITVTQVLSCSPLAVSPLYMPSFPYRSTGIYHMMEVFWL